MPGSEDKTLQLTRKLPEDNWPSITADTNGKKEPNGRLLSGTSLAGDEKEEGEVCDSEDEETTVETVKGMWRVFIVETNYQGVEYKTYR
jgi:hypothetical protein